MIIKKIILSYANLHKLIAIILYIFVLSQSNGFAGFELSGAGARSRAMGKAYVGLANSSDAIFINCSGLAQIKQLSCSFQYSHPFGIKELINSSGALVLPTSFGTFSTGFQNYGNKIYNEQSFLIAYSMSINDKFSIGANFHYMKLQISNYSSNFSLTFDTGFLLKLTETVNWGFFLTNLTYAKIGKCEENIPQTFCTGLSANPIKDIILNFDIFKDAAFPLEIRMGVEYLLLQKIALRTGFISEPSQICGGLGILFSCFEIDYSVNTHPDLSLTHLFTLQITKRNKKATKVSIKKIVKDISLEVTKININTASKAELQKLKGIGPTLAERIISYRRQNGKFIAITDLIKIKGINKNKLKQIEGLLTL